MRQSVSACVHTITFKSQSIDSPISTPSSSVLIWWGHFFAVLVCIWYDEIGTRPPSSSEAPHPESSCPLWFLNHCPFLPHSHGTFGPIYYLTSLSNPPLVFIQPKSVLVRFQCPEVQALTSMARYEPGVHLILLLWFQSIGFCIGELISLERSLRPYVLHLNGTIPKSSSNALFHPIPPSLLLRHSPIVTCIWYSDDLGPTPLFVLSAFSYCYLYLIQWPRQTTSKLNPLPLRPVICLS